MKAQRGNEEKDTRGSESVGRAGHGDSCCAEGQSRSQGSDNLGRDLRRVAIRFATEDLQTGGRDTVSAAAVSGHGRSRAMLEVEGEDMRTAGRRAVSNLGICMPGGQAVMPIRRRRPSSDEAVGYRKE